MRKMKRLGRRAAGWLLAAAVACSGALLYAVADAVNDWRDAKLGELSQLYETGSNPDPGMIATVSGDAGGKSYGLYMFASNPGTPRLFFEWLLGHEYSVYRDMGSILSAAYYQGGAGCGSNFDAAWTSLANIYGDLFGEAQTDYVRSQFYDKLVAQVEAAVPNFDMDNFSIALQNVFWSRAVQHGVSGAYNVVTRAMAELGGFKNQSEAELISAIYAESGKLTTGYSNVMSGTTAEKYGVSGKSLAYFTGCSGSIQLGVYTRLRLNESSDALVMLYNNLNAPEGNGTYRLSDGDGRYLLAEDGKLTLGGGEGTDLTLTYFASDYYTITFAGTDTRLSVSGGKVAPESASASQAQMWRLENVNGGYALQNRSTGTYLTIYTEESGKRLGLADSPENATAWRLALAGNGWSTSGMFYPSEATTLISGESSFPIRGTIRSNSTITSVQVAVLNAGGLPISYASASAKPMSTQYNLRYLDSSIAISKLPAGTYTYRVTATNSGGTETLVESPFTVCAPSQITVTYDGNGGAISGNASAVLTVGQPYGTLPAAAKEGSVFLGWFDDDGNQIIESSVVPGSSLTLHARFSGMPTYTFKDRNGNVITTAALATGALIPAPASPAAWSDGSYAYTFKQWVSGSTVYEFGVTVMGESDMVFTPEFNKQALSGGSSGGSTGGGSTGGGSTGGSTGGGVTVGGSELTGFVPGTSVSSFAASMGATVYTADGTTQVTSGNIATGMIAKIGGSSYTIVVKGDANGDGAMSISDVVKLQSHVVGRSTLSGAYATAGDLNGDGKISITDVVQAAQVVVGKRTLG